MPELPEVEITRRGIEPHLLGRVLAGVVVRQPRLRYPVPEDLDARVRGKVVTRVERRGKYLLIQLGSDWLLIHLGMSGSLRVVPADAPPQLHDHVDIVVEGGEVVRLRDPRRFGCVLWVPHPCEQHPLLAELGVEPETPAFNGAWLHAISRGLKTPIKLMLMDAHRVVGVGNIYASESLFRAAIHPQTPAGSLSLARCERLAQCVKETLADALAAGGSSLRDFIHSDGSSGYFQQRYNVYGREGEPCRRCGGTVRRVVMGQRATFFCPSCQHRRGR